MVLSFAAFSVSSLLRSLQLVMDLPDMVVHKFNTLKLRLLIH